MKSVIVDQALRALTGIRLKFFNQEGSARRLLFFYSFIFKRSPIVVISVPERQDDEPYARVTPGVRALADKFGLRVIVDGSPNSIPPELLTTKREMVIDVEPMSKELLESIPEYKVLTDFLRSQNIDESVWKVIGGSPMDYLTLNELFLDCLSVPNTSSDEIVSQVKYSLKLILYNTLSKNVLKSSTNTKAIIDTFREMKTIKISVAKLKARGFSLDYPNKVFREVFTKEGWCVVPSSPAVSLIITENIESDEDVPELLDKLFKTI